jgi:hypothetical protein
MSGIRPRSPKQMVCWDNGKTIYLKNVIRDNDSLCRREYLNHRTNEVVGWITYEAIAQDKIGYYEPIGYWRWSDE